MSHIAFHSANSAYRLEPARKPPMVFPKPLILNSRHIFKLNNGSLFYHRNQFSAANPSILTARKRFHEPSEVVLTNHSQDLNKFVCFYAGLINSQG